MLPSPVPTLVEPPSPLRRRFAILAALALLASIAVAATGPLRTSGDDVVGPALGLAAAPMALASGEDTDSIALLPILGDPAEIAEVASGVRALSVDVPGLATSVEIRSSVLATALAATGSVDIWAYPDAREAPEWSLSVPTEFGGPRHFRVIAEYGAWLKVQVPVRPNGTEGWIPRDAVELAPVTTRVEVDLSERSVIVWDGDDVVMDTSGTIGAPRTPTPTGTYYIRDAFPWYPDSIYGPWVLALSAYSEAIDEINGGAAVVALHGTQRPDLVGRAASLGCIRLDNETITELAGLVGPGTPVEIVP